MMVRAKNLDSNSGSLSFQIGSNKRSANSYDFIRFCAAAAVLFSHHFVLWAGLPEPEVPLYGLDFGKLGVAVFFCLSGFLICLSLQRSNDWADYFAARALRIFPNLAFMLVVTSAATLIWYSNYSQAWEHFKYVIRNLLMFIRGVRYQINGVFGDVMSDAINGPLWSLPYEGWLYVALFFVFLIGVRFAAKLTTVLALVLSVGWSVSPLFKSFGVPPMDIDIHQFFRLGSFFLSGALVAFLWPRISHRAFAVGITSLVALVLVRQYMPFETILHTLALSGAVIGLGHSAAMAWFARGGDPSYGMYIFAWPVQQFFIIALGDFWPSLFCAFAATTAIGYATWHGFERRLMSRRQWLADLMRRQVKQRSRSPVTPIPTREKITRRG